MNNKLSISLEVWGKDGVGVQRELADSVSFEISLWAQKTPDLPWIVCPRVTDMSTTDDRVHFVVRTCPLRRPLVASARLK